MKHIGIQTPCTEDRGKMTPNEKGSFCHKCAKQVHDFTNKSTGEIKQLFRDMMGQEICGRMTIDQENALNAEFEAWKFQSKQGFQRAMVFSLVVVFGLTLFSCSNEQDKQQIKHLQTVALQAMNDSERETQEQTTPEQQILPQKKMLQWKEKQLKYKDYVQQDSLVKEYAIAQEPLIFPQTQIDGGIGMSMDYKAFLNEKITPVEYDNNGNVIPTAFSSKVYPNPATDQTTFELAIPQRDHFVIKLFDQSGSFIQEIYSGDLERGTFQQQIQLSNLNPGIYLITILSKEYIKTLRISKN